jgi:hypothetical protein
VDDEVVAQDLRINDRGFVSQNCCPRELSLSSLALSNFRNYAYARMELSPEPVVLTGENGAGKTNILEAISLLTVGRGLRRAKLSEIDLKNPLPLREGAGGGVFSNISGSDFGSTPHPNPPPQGGREQQPWAVSANVIGRFGAVKIGTRCRSSINLPPNGGGE